LMEKLLSGDGIKVTNWDMVCVDTFFGNKSKD
jgi:hypothetical protein